jgi:L,D-transpeptidase-like protein
MRRALSVAALLVVCGASSAGATPGVTQVLSNEVTFARWARPLDTAPIRRNPSTSSRVVTRLHFMTEDLQPETYLALAERTVGSVDWVRIRIPMRPNGRTGWVRRTDLGAFHLVTTRIVVNEATLRATLYRSGHRVWRSIIGVGMPGADTPKGHFWVREKLTGYASPAYGPVALGTSDYSRLSEWPHGGVVGIHGTNEPQLLPGRVSHGCIRVPNAAMLRLARLAKVGTPILIR